MKRIALIFAAAMLLSVGLWSCEKDGDSNTSASAGGDNGGGGNGGVQTPDGWVDLGLPSGLLWAECNVGAGSPEEEGDYYAWGETEPKSDYSVGTYHYTNGDFDQLTKYCNASNYGYRGFTDNLTTLQPGDDAATANLDGDARTPTLSEWQELIDNTGSTWTTQNGVYGRKLTATNGDSLFLPAVGGRAGAELISAGSDGYYWSSSLHTDDPNYAAVFYFSSGVLRTGKIARALGLPVRAVRSPQK